jgi:hypothetical protein
MKLRGRECGLLDINKSENNPNILLNLFSKNEENEIKGEFPFPPTKRGVSLFF